MANLRVRNENSQDSTKKPRYEIDFTFKGQRKSLPLSAKKYSKKTATRLLDVIEKLVFYNENDTVLDKQTMNWIESTTPDIRKKLVKMGLILIPETYTLKELWDMFQQQKNNIKESTEKTYEAARRRFFEFFKENEIVTDLPQSRIKQWKESLKESLAESTIAGTITKTKAVFNWAISAGMIEKSPLSGVGRGSFVNRTKDRFITPEEYNLLLDSCPCQDWRVIIALARYGGLRCPSEVVPLRWSDVLWDRDRFWVASPKTEHHQGKEGRWVPLFPELKVELDCLFFRQMSKGQEFVINRYRDPLQNLGTTFEKIAKKAGIGPIKKPFTNMRASRSTEVYDKWGPHKESKWIGHSTKVAHQHYLQIRDEDYKMAATNDYGPKAKNRSTQGRENNVGASRLETHSTVAWNDPEISWTTPEKIGTCSYIT